MPTTNISYSQIHQALAETYVRGGRRDPPDHLMCPITHDVFEDPVVNAAGSTYSRAAIMQHIAVSREDAQYSDPMTRKAVFVNVRGSEMTWDCLFANHVLKTQVNAFDDAVQAALKSRANLVGARYAAFKKGREARDSLLAKALAQHDMAAVAFCTRRPGLYSLHRSQELVQGVRSGAAACIQAAWRGGQLRVTQLADALASGSEAADVLEKHTSKAKARQLLQQRRTSAVQVRLVVR